MKIKFLTIILILLCLPFYSCHSSNKEENYVSQLRKNVFYGENSDICVKVYSEEREHPFINDAKANPRESFIIVKVLNSDKLTSVKVSYLKQNYSATCQYNIASTSMDCTIKVSSLPANAVFVTVETEESSTRVECLSQLKNNTISPFSALDKVKTQQKDFISSLTNNGTFNAEIYIRLICEGDYNFYYVGFAQGNNKITAFLVDGITGEIIAGKT